MEISWYFQELFLSLGMGKRLTPEEKEARLKAYQEAKAAKQKAREERKKAQQSRKERKYLKPAEYPESSVVGYIKGLPAFHGKIEPEDQVRFRFLGMLLEGRVTKHVGKEKLTYEGQQEYYAILDESEGVVYPIKKNDILFKKINDEWKEKA